MILRDLRRIKRKPELPVEAAQYPQQFVSPIHLRHLVDIDILTSLDALFLLSIFKNIATLHGSHGKVNMTKEHS